MEVVGSVAAVTQILSQTISLIERIQDDRAMVKGASERMQNTTDEVEATRKTVVMIDEEKDLQKPLVIDQVKQVRTVCEELSSTLEDQQSRSERSTLRRISHSLRKGKDENHEMDDLLDRLSRGKNELMQRIQCVHVGVSRDSNKILVASLPRIKMLDDKLRSVLGVNLQIRELLEKDRSLEWAMTVPLKPSVLEALRDPIEYSEAQQLRSYNANVTDGRANLIAGDVGEVTTPTNMNIEYKGNAARGDSTMVLGGMDGATFSAWKQTQK